MPSVSRAISAESTRRATLRQNEVIAEKTQNLRESEERFRLMVAAVKDYAIIMLDLGGYIISWNAGAQRFKGYEAEEIIGKHFSHFYPAAELKSGVPEMALKAAVADGRFESEGWQVRKDGSQFWAHVVITPVRDGAGIIQGFSDVSRDITERRLAAIKLEESEERFRQLAEYSSEVFWFLGRDPERMQYVSPAVETIWGVPPRVFYENPKAWVEAIHAEDQPRVRAAYEKAFSGEAARFEAEYRVILPDGSTRWVLDSGTPIKDENGRIFRIGGIAKDVTARKQLEVDRLRSQRLESIGTLVGGISHDLNNALAPIMMGIELLRLRMPADASIINTMELSARHGAGMVRQLLTFAKGIEGARLLIQPQHLFNELETIIRGSFPKNIELRTNFARNLHAVLGDITQLNQVLLNLCVNARDAMPNGGTLTLEAENVTIDETFASACPDAAVGKYVVWRIWDSGTGIPAAIIDRIFEPFFTTKGADKGTGLGLSTVIGIVRSHNGFVQVYSNPGAGTCFSVYLPVDTENGVASATPFLQKSAFHGSGETILIVDDDSAVRQMSRTVLTTLNFQVVTASDGTEALIQVAEKRAALKVVITDMHMPHLDGLNFVRILKRMLPDVGVIVSSGMLSEHDATELRLLGVSALLEKPFTQDQLERALEGVLAKTPDSGR